MSTLEILLGFVAAAVIFMAVPYSIAYWATRGKLGAARDVMNKVEDCGDIDCPLHGDIDL